MSCLKKMSETCLEKIDVLVLNSCHLTVEEFRSLTEVGEYSSRILRNSGNTMVRLASDAKMFDTLNKFNGKIGLNFEKIVDFAINCGFSGILFDQDAKFIDELEMFESEC